jgi:hypothetical protein
MYSGPGAVELPFVRGLMPGAPAVPCVNERLPLRKTASSPPDMHINYLLNVREIFFAL